MLAPGLLLHPMNGHSFLDYVIRAKITCAGPIKAFSHQLSTPMKPYINYNIWTMSESELYYTFIL